MINGSRSCIRMMAFPVAYRVCLSYFVIFLCRKIRQNNLTVCIINVFTISSHKISCISAKYSSKLDILLSICIIYGAGIGSNIGAYNHNWRYVRSEDCYYDGEYLDEVTKKYSWFFLEKCK